MLLHDLREDDTIAKRPPRSLPPGFDNFVSYVADLEINPVTG